MKDRAIGEIDIDSDLEDAFRVEDKLFLEQVAKMLAEKLESL